MSVTFDATCFDEFTPSIKRPKLAEVGSGILEVRAMDLQGIKLLDGLSGEARAEGRKHFCQLPGRFSFEGFLKPHCLPPFIWLT